MAFNKVVPNKPRNPTTNEIATAMKVLLRYGMEKVVYPDLYNDLITAVMEETDANENV